MICSALGFDTFLVLRHGYKTSHCDTRDVTMTKSMVIPGNQLGCYFCNDVVAPGDVSVSFILYACVSWLFCVRHFMLFDFHYLAV